MLGLMVVPRKRLALADASANPTPSTSDTAGHKTAETVTTGPIGSVAFVLFARRTLRFVLLGQGGFVGPRACNQALQPTQGESVVSYLVLPR